MMYDQCIKCHLNKGFWFTGGFPCGLSACANPPPRTYMSSKIEPMVMPPNFKYDFHYPILKYRKCHPDAVPPKYIRKGDSCMDLSITEDVEIQPLCYEDYEEPRPEGQQWGISHRRHRQTDARVTVGTGLCFEIPEGYKMNVYIRSGHAFKQGLTLVGAVGIIDENYRGEVKLCLVNLGTEKVYLKKGERVAQCEVVPVTRVVVSEALELSPNAERGENGFGSSGK